MTIAKQLEIMDECKHHNKIELERFKALSAKDKEHNDCLVGRTKASAERKIK